MDRKETNLIFIEAETLKSNGTYIQWRSGLARLLWFCEGVLLRIESEEAQFCRAVPEGIWWKHHRFSSSDLVSTFPRVRGKDRVPHLFLPLPVIFFFKFLFYLFKSQRRGPSLTPIPPVSLPSSCLSLELDLPECFFFSHTHFSNCSIHRLLRLPICFLNVSRVSKLIFHTFTKFCSFWPLLLLLQHQLFQDFCYQLPIVLRCSCSFISFIILSIMIKIIQFRLCPRSSSSSLPPSPFPLLSFFL